MRCCQAICQCHYSNIILLELLRNKESLLIKTNLPVLLDFVLCSTRANIKKKFLSRPNYQAVNHAGLWHQPVNPF